MLVDHVGAEGLAGSPTTSRSGSTTAWSTPTARRPAEELATGRAVDLDLVHARDGRRPAPAWSSSSTRSTHTTSEFLRREQELLLDGRGLPELATQPRRPAGRGRRPHADHADLQALAPFVREQAPGDRRGRRAPPTTCSAIELGARRRGRRRPGTGLAAVGDALRVAADVVLRRAARLEPGRAGERSSGSASSPALGRLHRRPPRTSRCCSPTARRRPGRRRRACTPGSRTSSTDQQAGQASTFATRLKVGVPAGGRQRRPRALHQPRPRRCRSLLVAAGRAGRLVAAIAVTPVGQDWAPGRQLVDYLQGLSDDTMIASATTSPPSWRSSSPWPSASRSAAGRWPATDDDAAGDDQPPTTRVRASPSRRRATTPTRTPTRFAAAGAARLYADGAATATRPRSSRCPAPSRARSRRSARRSSAAGGGDHRHLHARRRRWSTPTRRRSVDSLGSQLVDPARRPAHRRRRRRRTTGWASCSALAIGHRPGVLGARRPGRGHDPRRPWPTAELLDVAGRRRATRPLVAGRPAARATRARRRASATRTMLSGLVNGLAPTPPGSSWSATPTRPTTASSPRCARVELAGPVSTVDGVETALGQVTAVLALIARARRNRSAPTVRRVRTAPYPLG